MGITVAAIQTIPVSGNPEKTLQKGLALLDQASKQDVQLAVFPELFYPGYELYNTAKKNPKKYDHLMAQFIPLAETVPGNTIQRFCDKAREHEMHVVFTLLERGEHESLHNSSVLIDSDGNIRNVHRKTILTPFFETPEIAAGSEFSVTETAIGNIGQLICADSSCPEGPRILAIKGADILCLSMGGCSIMVDGHNVMDPIMEHCHASNSRAVDNGVFFIVANLSGREGSVEFFGKSKIVSPFGIVLARGQEGVDNEELVIAEIEIDELKSIPLKMIERRRPEIYEDILQPNRY
ncbi:MAG: carbon-nitrogen hydrolase family protein [Deltaproteobacteria bacterium]|nr:carbon-nitrogen hydrolase family protein [Deltaproteobacteria bacterium]